MFSTYSESTEIVDKQADYLRNHVNRAGVRDVLRLVVKWDSLSNLHCAKHEGELKEDLGHLTSSDGTTYICDGCSGHGDRFQL